MCGDAILVCSLCRAARGGGLGLLPRQSYDLGERGDRFWLNSGVTILMELSKSVSGVVR